MINSHGESTYQNPINQVHNFDDEDNQLQGDLTDESISEDAEEKEDYENQSDESSCERSKLISTNYSASKREVLQAWKNILKQHPWSVSDPGPPSLVAESCHRGYYSSPTMLGGVLLADQQGGQEGKFTWLVTRVMSKTLGNKAFLKWVFIVLNVIVELCQATFTQEAAQGKMGHHYYLKLSIITSSICLTMSLVETFHEGYMGFCYPGNRIQGRDFARFSLYFGLVSSMIQLILNLVAKFTKKSIIKFDYVPLLLSVCYLAAEIIASREKTSLAGIVKCKSHGYNAVEFTSFDDDGNWVLECPECQIEDST